METRKVDFINGAYSLMRINGLTVGPDGFGLTTALKRLENMAYMYEGRNISTGYNFTENPDLQDFTNVPKEFTLMYESNLAVLLCNDFGTDLPPALMLMASSTLSAGSSLSAIRNLQNVPYPNRMPIGSGNTQRYRPFNTFYTGAPNAPAEATTNNLYIGDINSYTEDYTQYLRDGESISSYTIDADPGLTLLSDSLSSPVITYEVQGVSQQSIGNWQQVKIIVTTSLGRINTRLINFNVIQANTVGSN